MMRRGVRAPDVIVAHKAKGHGPSQPTMSDFPQPHEVVVGLRIQELQLIRVVKQVVENVRSHAAIHFVHIPG
jgi:hypothetical protein